MTTTLGQPILRSLVTLLLAALVAAPLYGGGSIQRLDRNRADTQNLFTNLFIDARTLPWNFSVARSGLPEIRDDNKPIECGTRSNTRGISAQELRDTVFAPSFRRFSDNPLAFIHYEQGSGSERDGDGASNRDGITDTDSTGFDGENVQTFTEPQLATPAAAVVAISLTTRVRVECKFVGPFKATRCRSSSPDSSFFDFPTGMDFNGDGALNEPFSENFASLAVDENGNFVNGPVVIQAGTVIDQDVAYNGPCVELSNDNAPATIDIYGVAIHENGHGQGLSHQLIRNATMFPFVSDNVFSLRTPQVDDLISSSLLYPRAGIATFASATTNSAAPDGQNRQYEVSTFLPSQALGTITGEVVDAAGRPVFGAHVFAVAVDVNTDPAKAPNTQVAGLLRGLFNSDEQSTTNMDTIEPGDAVVGDYSGTLLLGTPDTRTTRNSLDPNRNDFVLANLLPGTYAIAVEAIDGDPVSVASISSTIFNPDAPLCINITPNTGTCDPITNVAILPEFYTSDESGADETQVAKGNSRAGGEPGTSGFELSTAPTNTVRFAVAPGQRIDGIRIVINSGVDGVGDEPDADSAFANDVPETALDSIAPPAGGGSSAGQDVVISARSQDDGATIGSTTGVPRTSNVDETRSTLAFLFDSSTAGFLGRQIREATTVAAPADGRGRDLFDATQRVTLPEGRQLVSVRAVDTENDEGPQSQVAEPLFVANDDNAAIEYAGGWHRESGSNASFGSYRRHAGSGAGHRATATFSGDTITYIYATSSVGGSANVLIDGVLRQTISYAGAGTPKNPQFGHSATFSNLGPGNHTIEIQPLDKTVYIDSFIARGGAVDLLNTGELRSGATQTTSGTAAALGTALATVTVPANAVELSVVLEWEGSANLRMQLLDAAGTLVKAVDSAQPFEVIDVPAVAAGNYTVVVTNPSTDNVSFTLSSTPTVK